MTSLDRAGEQAAGHQSSRKPAYRHTERRSTDKLVRIRGFHFQEKAGDRKQGADLVPGGEGISAEERVRAGRPTEEG